MFSRDLPGEPVTADEFRLDSRRTLKTQIMCLLFLQTLLFWAFPYFPSQDGPAHLGSAAVLSGLSAGDALYQQIYASAWQFDSNQLYHAMLVLLGKFMPLLAAEKLILSLYGAAFIASLWHLIGSVHGRHEAVLLGLPVIFTDVLYMGFFNSCLAFVAGIWSLGLFFKLQEHCSWQRMASLASALLLTYFLHIFILLILLPAMLLLSIVRYFTGLQQRRILEATCFSPHQNFRWTATFGWILAAIPSIALLIHFMATTNESAAADSASLLQQSGAVASFNGFRLLVKAYHILITFSMLDLAMQLPWLALLMWIAVCCLRTRKASEGIKVSTMAFNHAYLWVAFVAVLLLILVLPITSGPIVIVDQRLSPFLFVALITWLSTGALSSRQWHLMASLATLIVGAQLIYRFPAHANLNADIAEFVQVQTKIPAKSSLLTIDMGPESHGYLGLGGQHLQFNHMVHAGGYLVLDKSLVNIRNYQLGFPYFPIRFNSGISLSQVSPLWDKSEFVFDLAATKLQPIPPLNTVSVFSDLATPEKRQAFDSLRSELNRQGFTQTFVSSPNSLARVFSK